MEIWKPVHGYEGYYEVSNMGNVRPILRRMGSRPYRNLKPCRKGAGYSGIHLFKDGKGYQTYIHILVAKAFLGEIPEGKEPNHKNGNKSDNSVDNLEFLTHSENCHHAHTNLLSVTRNPNGTFKKFAHL